MFRYSSLVANSSVPPSFLRFSAERVGNKEFHDTQAASAPTGDGWMPRLWQESVAIAEALRRECSKSRVVAKK